MTLGRGVHDWFPSAVGRVQTATSGGDRRAPSGPLREAFVSRWVVGELLSPTGVYEQHV